ncbi:hypothetical protein BDZ97DRAFT_1310433 [Flammula alnicola]|nr:hypothetical protein BDZ97DRAFT_1310433 [Flammula alnicola]
MDSEDDKKSLSDVSDGDLNSDMEDEKPPLLSSRGSTPTSSRSPSPERTTPRFTQPTPSPLKRAALLIFLGLLLWIGFQMRFGLLEATRKPKIVHASRYSKEHKFRPAASPVITETLKDGRIRLRGALPAPTAAQTPVATKSSKGSSKGKRKTGKSKRRAGSGAGRRV